MLLKLLIAFALMALCVAIHATGLTAILRSLRSQVAGSQNFWSSTSRLIRVAGATILLHLAQILAWAVLYVSCRVMPNFTTAAYFSAVTYTTTGYGDLVLPLDWRILGGVEALTGILMCGLSTGMFFAVFLQIFGLKTRDSSPS